MDRVEVERILLIIKEAAEGAAGEPVNDPREAFRQFARRIDDAVVALWKREG